MKKILENIKPHLILDLDGVMCCDNQYFSNIKIWHPCFDVYPFDKKCVKVLNEIIEEINPVIVLSSDWKFHFSLDQMNEIFEWNKINGKISHYTPDLWGVKFKSISQLEECRATEILKYVEIHNVQNYVAVDDLNLLKWIPNNFVHCKHCREGISQLGVKEKNLNIINK